MQIQYAKTIELRHETDVFIAGGGPAGVAAACAAARQGASVFLAEAQGAFGGAGTTGLVPAFMPFGNGVDFLAGGIGREVFDALTEMGAPHEGLHSCVGIQAEQLKLVYDRMLTEAGVQFSLHTALMDVAVSDGHVQHVVLSAKSGLFAVKAKVYIDCTGDGDLCAWAGAPFELGNEDGLTMPATLCSLWANVDWSRTAGRDAQALEKAFADGIFTQEDRHLPGMFRVTDEAGNRNLGGGNIGHAFAVDATDERSLTTAMLWGRRYMAEYEKYYKEYLSGYEDMRLCATGAYLGVRESRRIMGDYVLNVDDFNNRASFEDEIGRFSYPVDIHIMTPDKAAYDTFHAEHRDMRYKDGESYGIPYRCLLPKNLTNVLVAGRCVSTDRPMQSSIRVMPGCYIMGQAVGVAAAMAGANGDVRAVDVPVLQNRLRAMGAFLPKRV